MFVYVPAAILLLYAQTVHSVTSIALPSAIASRNALTTSTSLPYPTSTLSSSDTQKFLLSSWSLSTDRIQDGGNNLAFVDNPFLDSTAPVGISASAPVLQVTYPDGSFSHDTGGAQLYAFWNASDTNSSDTQFHSMLLSYEVAFDTDFDWVKGGKLPGIRGGPDVYGCSGGQPTNGSDCFSTRVMWRTDGQGEVYAYILESDGLCTDSDVICNSDDYGTSLNRGSFDFMAGRWNRVTLLVRLNDPDMANGQLSLYYNNMKALEHTNLQYRNTSDVGIGGLYFSTFFGGMLDAAWATPRTVHAYFRNFRMWGSIEGSNNTATSGSPPTRVNVCLSVSILILLSTLITFCS
ncbi:polysaccharide lyase family 14 protein [Wolfiporia cocos MD-104 SS10]|uniref:Polysaccharide lyase family 14 protein n=1 Tax=Wolfiporia cocos (strain MD-104) TaxID=742152 RepID=A0A2H3JQG0_WOLCO|nr:polysaccharide lyase family 14 protein [Wolfiporia cocos MD-104 SS10]